MITNWSPPLESVPSAPTSGFKPSDGSSAPACWLAIFSESLTNSTHPLFLETGAKAAPSFAPAREESEPRAESSDPSGPGIDPTVVVAVPVPVQTLNPLLYFKAITLLASSSELKPALDSLEPVFRKMDDLFDSFVQTGDENSMKQNYGATRDSGLVESLEDISFQSLTPHFDSSEPTVQASTGANVSFPTPLSGFEQPSGVQGVPPDGTAFAGSGNIRPEPEVPVSNPDLPAPKGTQPVTELSDPSSETSSQFQAQIISHSSRKDGLNQSVDFGFDPRLSNELFTPSPVSRPTSWVEQVRDAVNQQLSQQPDSVSPPDGGTSSATSLPSTNSVAPAPLRDPAQRGIPTFTLPEPRLQIEQNDDQPAATLHVSEPGGPTQHQPVKVSKPVLSSTASNPSRQLVNPILEALPGATGFKIRTLTLHLLPDHLGKVEVTLSRSSDGNLNTRIVTETLEAHAELGQGIQSLREALEQAAPVSGQIEVSLHLNAGSHSHHQFHQDQPSSPAPGVENQSGSVGNSKPDEEAQPPIHLSSDGLVSLHA